MKVWHGMSSKTSNVDSTVGISEVQENTRLRTDGELQRRWGMIASGAPQQDGPILLIAASVRGNFLTFDVDAGATREIEGLGPLPDPLIDGPKWKKPDVVAGDPQAPVINFVTAFPPSPGPYGIGPVTFTPNFTYDGLSGPLIWAWTANNGGPATPFPTSINTEVGIWDFNGFCIPGLYLNFGVTATTTIGGLQGSFGFDYEIA